MKKILIIFCAFFCFSRQAFSENVYLVSFARSGSEWMMYYTQFVTKRKWYWGGSTLVYDPLKHLIDHSLTGFYRSHTIRDGFFGTPEEETHRAYDKEKDKLIVLVRNYKECMVRNWHNREFDHIIDFLEIEKNSYCELLRVFDNWSSENKLLIYYEDLMQYPAQEFEKVARFVQADIYRHRKFMAKYQKHRQISFSLKHKTFKTPSHGLDLHFHSKKIGIEKCRQMDEIMQNKHPDLCATHLNRYIPNCNLLKDKNP